MFVRDIILEWSCLDNWKMLDLISNFFFIPHLENTASTVQAILEMITALFKVISQSIL